MFQKTTFLVILCLTCFIPVPNCIAAQQDHPNVLLIMVEDLNDWVGYIGGPRITPNIDRLASSSHQFFNAYCVSPTCNASRVAMLTGQRPSVTGMIGNVGNFRDMVGGENRLTIPEYFRQEAGYATAAAGKIFHVGRGGYDYPLPQSDPQSWDFQYPQRSGADGLEFYLDENNIALWLNGESSNNDYLNKYCAWGYARNPLGELQKVSETPEIEQTEFAMTFLEQEHDGPFFLGLGLTGPHQPLIAPKECFDQIRARYPAGIPDLYLPEFDLDDIVASSQTNFSSPMVELIKSKGEMKNAVEAYLASVAFIDAAVGQVITTLENSQYADNTIVVFASDHGFLLGHKDRWEKFELWKQSSRTPLLIRLPGQTEAKQIRQSVSLLDIYPTLTELAGLSENKNNQGRSLVEEMTSSLLQPICSSVTTAVGYGRFKHEYSVHQDGWNYIHREYGAEELYDHSTDPHEVHNVADLNVHDPRKRRMASEIVRSAIRVANRDFDFSNVSTLGNKSFVSFDGLSGNLDDYLNWKTIQFGYSAGNNDFLVEDDRVTSVPGRIVSQVENISLRRSHDFTMAVDVTLVGSGVAAGLAFEIEDQDNYYEFLVTDGEVLNGTDVIFRRWQDGVAYDIYVERNLDDVVPGSSWNLIVDYNSRNSTLTLTVLDSIKDVFFKRRFDIAVNTGTRFGMSSFHHPMVEFDNFRLLAVPELPLAEPVGGDEPNCGAINEMEHIDTFEDLELGFLSLQDMGWTLQKSGSGQLGDFVINKGHMISFDTQGKIVATRDEPILKPRDEFVVVARTKFTGSGHSAGVVFGFEDTNNYYEFDLVDGRQNDRVDVELIRWVNGIPNVILSRSNLPDMQYWNEYVTQLSYSRGLLEIVVFDATDGELYFSDQRILERSIGKRFGLTSNQNGNCRFDYFRVVAGKSAVSLNEQCYFLD